MDGPANPPPQLRSRVFRGDPVLEAVASGRVRLGRPSEPPRPTPVRSTGVAIEKVKGALFTLGLPPSRDPRGQYGDDTYRLVQSYQRRFNIRAPNGSFDGIAGPETIAHLDAALAGAASGPPSARPAGPQMTTATGRRWERAPGVSVPGSTVQPLMDGAASFIAIQRAIRSATGPQHYIYLLGVRPVGLSERSGDVAARPGRAGREPRSQDPGAPLGAAARLPSAFPTPYRCRRCAQPHPELPCSAGCRRRPAVRQEPPPEAPGRQGPAGARRPVRWCRHQRRPPPRSPPTRRSRPSRPASHRLDKQQRGERWERSRRRGGAHAPFTSGSQVRVRSRSCTGSSGAGTLDRGAGQSTRLRLSGEPLPSPCPHPPAVSSSGRARHSAGGSCFPMGAGRPPACGRCRTSGCGRSLAPAGSSTWRSSTSSASAPPRPSGASSASSTTSRS
jgi:hypothetical protein